MTVNNYKTGPKGLALIKRWEGCHKVLRDGRITSYLCPAGVWTIGYGTTEGVQPGQIITQAQAERLLQRDLAKFEAVVNDAVTVPITQNQFDALVSFTYNCGAKAFRDSTLLKRVNERRSTEAAAQFQRWNKAGGKVLAGLVARRADEANLFLS